MTEKLRRIKRQRTILLLTIAVLYLLTLDWWSWESTGLVWNFPAFFVRIIVIQLLLTVTIFLLVRHFWPEVTEKDVEDTLPPDEP